MRSGGRAGDARLASAVFFALLPLSLRLACLPVACSLVLCGLLIVAEGKRAATDARRRLRLSA